jgi:hypothetical protein
MHDGHAPWLLKPCPRRLCLQADMVNHKEKMDLVLSLDNSYTRFLVHSRDVLLKTMKVCGA